MSTAENYFNQLITEVPDAKPGKMFGALIMKMPNGKAGAMFWKDFLIVKLASKALDEAMKLKGAKTFEPMEGRPMNGWIQLSFDHKAKWKELALASAAGVAKIPAKAAKKKL